MLLVEELFNSAEDAGLQPTMELFNFTNVKTFKIVFSKELRDAMSLTKAGNRAYKSGSYKLAADNYKEALAKWNNCIRQLKAVPETSIGWLSLADWILWVPFVNFALIILASISNMVINSTSDGYSRYSSGRYATPELTRKLNEAIQTKSFSKIMIMNALVLCQDFTETRIKECADGGSKSAFESVYITMQEGSIDAVIECCDGLYD